jgi:hypothetical protein
MTGRMTGWTDGKDDPPRTKPSLLYKKISSSLNVPLEQHSNAQNISHWGSTFNHA